MKALSGNTHRRPIRKPKAHKEKYPLFRVMQVPQLRAYYSKQFGDHVVVFVTLKSRPTEEAASRNVVMLIRAYLHKHNLNADSSLLLKEGAVVFIFDDQKAGTEFAGGFPSSLGGASCYRGGQLIIEVNPSESPLTYLSDAEFKEQEVILD